MLGDRQRRAEVSVPGELVIKADWYHYAAKYEPGGMELVVPAPIGDDAIARVRELAPPTSSRPAAARGLARCDFFVDDDGESCVNELNTIPGFTETSVFAKLFEATGLAYPDLCDRLVELAIERHRSSSYESTSTRTYSASRRGRGAGASAPDPILSSTAGRRRSRRGVPRGSTARDPDQEVAVGSLVSRLDRLPGADVARPLTIPPAVDLIRRALQVRPVDLEIPAAPAVRSSIGSASPACRRRRRGRRRACRHALGPA